ncbi:dephospho-CoA kinase [Limibaculum sp. M0105]|uniref:Dephospho-CoA kinase n=1 Tax=Thermohalobaculum xanthum TaxID=2753746 RepID=A0A8J7M8Z7_9RHOB|nr:dephospho-CoA kinase [Thermohalobaculum xanthum]MBK0400521.1 dephospho-CoA kinase [Thermohalobaculum xanthum]
MITLGLTGSIGMGKSTTAKMFAALGVPVWDADAAVHRLYAAGAAGARAIAELAPRAVGAEGVDRAALRDAVLADDTLLPRIEAAIHPLVAADREAFIADARAVGAPLVLLDIPLLFETGADAWVDRVAVVSAPVELQRARVLERPGMTEAALDAILARQVPDAEKRRRADFVIETGEGMDAARAAVHQIVESLTGADKQGSKSDDA